MSVLTSLLIELNVLASEAFTIKTKSISKKKYLPNFKNHNFYCKISEDKSNKRVIIVYLIENIKAKVIHKIREIQKIKSIQILITIAKS
jgi:hypothetical protein